MLLVLRGPDLVEPRYLLVPSECELIEHSAWIANLQLLLLWMFNWFNELVVSHGGKKLLHTKQRYQCHHLFIHEEFLPKTDHSIIYVFLTSIIMNVEIWRSNLRERSRRLRQHITDMQSNYFWFSLWKDNKTINLTDAPGITKTHLQWLHVDTLIHDPPYKRRAVTKDCPKRQPRVWSAIPFIWASAEEQDDLKHQPLHCSTTRTVVFNQGSAELIGSTNKQAFAKNSTTVQYKIKRHQLISQKAKQWAELLTPFSSSSRHDSMVKWSTSLNVYHNITSYNLHLFLEKLHEWMMCRVPWANQYPV